MATHGAYFTNRLADRTIERVDHAPPDRLVNDNRESLTFTFTDGTKLTVWSYGYSLDAKIDTPTNLEKDALVDSALLAAWIDHGTKKA